MNSDWKCPKCNGINPPHRAFCLGCNTDNPNPQNIISSSVPIDEKSKGRRNMLFGSFWCIGGIIVTASSYSSASPGGTYIIAWGAIIFGGLQLLRGLGQYIFSPSIPATIQNIHIAQAYSIETPNKNIMMKKCPYCAESIRMEAIVCRYCRKDLPKTEIGHEDKDNNQPIIKLNNGITNLANNSIPMKNNETPKNPLQKKGGNILIIIVVTMITLIGLFLVLPSINNSLLPHPVPTIYIQPAREATNIPTIKPTKKLAPSKTSILDNCRSWTTIALVDVGKRICVYGKIINITWDNIAYYIAFSNKQNSFYILSYDYYYPDVGIGMCVMTTGDIKRLDNNPVIVILKNTELYVIKYC